jgi:hypothetical protein
MARGHSNYTKDNETMMFIIEGVIFICVAYIVVILILKAIEALQGDE